MATRQNVFSVQVDGRTVLWSTARSLGQRAIVVGGTVLVEDTGDHQKNERVAIATACVGNFLKRGV